MLGLCPDCALRQSIESRKADQMQCAARGPDGQPERGSTCWTNRKEKLERQARREAKL